MKSNNILEILKGTNIVIPYTLLKKSKELNINEKELIFLSFLMSNGDKTLFNVELISSKLCLEVKDVMSLISCLTEKKLLTMSVEKNSGGMMIEYLDISVLYIKLLGLIINEEEKKVSAESNIYSIIEKEFGRTISPIEYETIKGWLDSNLSEDLIKEALKEAVLNGVNNLKYIDKILFEWNKKGYKIPSDIKRKPKTKDHEELNLFDYDWLDENE